MLFAAIPALEDSRQLGTQLKMLVKSVSLGWDILPTQQNQLGMGFLELVTGDLCILANRLYLARWPT